MVGSVLVDLFIMADADNLEARLSYTSNLSLSTSYNLAGFTFQPHIFLFAAIVNQKGFVIPVQEFEDSSGWSLGNGFSVDEKKLKFNVNPRLLRVSISFILKCGPKDRFSSTLNCFKCESTLASIIFKA